MFCQLMRRRLIAFLCAYPILAAGTALGQSSPPAPSGDGGAPRDSWVQEGAATITVSSANYNAYLDKTTGLCDFCSKIGEPLFPNAGDTWVEEWDGTRQFDAYRETGFHTDDLWLRRSQYPVSSYAITDEGSAVTVAFTHGTPDGVQFETAYHFSQDGPIATISSSITYLEPKNVIHEMVSLGLSNDYPETAIDAFEPAVLVGDTQHDSLDAATNWQVFQQATVEPNTDPAFIHEGGGSMKATFTDDADGTTDYTGVFSSFSPVSYPGSTHLTFWIYPLQSMRIYVKLYNASGNVDTTSTYFAPNVWSLFQWDFAKSVGFQPTNVNRISIYAQDNSYGFTGPSATAYFDDLRFSQDVLNGLMTAAVGYGRDYWQADEGTLWLDAGRHDAGSAALCWANVNLTSTVKWISQATTLFDPAMSDPNVPTDLSAYDEMLVDVYVDCWMTTSMIWHLWDGFKHRYSNDYFLAPRRWMTVRWPFKRTGEYSDWPGGLNPAHIEQYGLRFFANGPSGNVTIWLDNLRLRRWHPDNVVLDSQSYDFAPDGVAVRYSPRLCKVGATTRVYADCFGATGVEMLEKAPGALNAYIYDGDRHAFRSSVSRLGNEGATTCYKELPRSTGEQAHAVLALAFYSTPPPEIVKGRWPRAFDAAYTISKDDLKFPYDKAFFCGTSDTNDPNYGKRGIVGHRLRVTNNLWYYLDPADGEGTCLDNPGVRTFLDLLHDQGVEIAIHTPGGWPDDRTAAVVALDALVNTYATRMWADHASSLNPEDFCRTGAFRSLNGLPNDGDTGYYMLDLLQQRGFRYIWPVANSLGRARSANLFCAKYDDVCPLPYTTRMIGANAQGQDIYLFGRTWGDGLNEFLQRGGGGNLAELQEIVAARGLVIVYTHAQINWSSGSGNNKVLKDEAEAVFAALEEMQDDGTLWIDTTSNILDWMVASEKVTIASQAGSSVVVTNGNNFPMRGITLQTLDATIQSARIGDRYQIYCTTNEVVLPEFAPNESKTVDFVMGAYDPAFPRLPHVDAHVDVLSAEYDAATHGITVRVSNNGNGDTADKHLSMVFKDSACSAVRDNGYLFATVVDGQIMDDDLLYAATYDSISGALDFALPELAGPREITVEVLFCQGACCLADGSCVDDQTPGACASQGGVHKGIGSVCTAGLCLGACCLTIIDCTDGVTRAACIALQGIFQGVDTTCAMGCIQPGDMNDDGRVDLDDVPIFVQVLLGQDPARAPLADINGDGFADGRDIGFFVNCLILGTCQ